MANLTRADKVQNIAIGLHVDQPNPDHEKYETEVVLTSLLGPHIVIKTPRYKGLVKVSFEGPVVTYEIKGVQQRFADSAAFLAFFRTSLESPRPATNSLATALTDALRVGNSVIFERRGTVYHCVEKSGMFEVRYNNQKMDMSGDDILMILA